MNYQKIYDEIIKKTKIENRIKLEKNQDGYIYYEKHHILPRCLGGNDKKENLILLTAKEHYVCHKLLVRIYPNNKSIYNAFYLMSLTGRSRYNISSRDYSYGKELFVSLPVSEKTKKLFKENRKDFSGKNNPMFGRHHTKDARKKQGMSMKGKEPANKGKKGLYHHSEEVLQKMRKPHGPFTIEHRQNISKSLTGNKFEIKMCPYCNKEISINNYSRWHEKNCKKYPKINL
jgi:hypothetical protein